MDILSIILFIIILLILITVHEFGHFIFARIFGVYVKEFSLGFGPKIFQRKGKETTFTIRALPLGGYAAIVGENGEDDDLPDVPFERTLKGVNRFKQFLIMFMGAGMNFILAFVIFCGLAATIPNANPEPIVGSVSANSPAAKAGLQVNDYMYQVKQNQEITPINTMSDLLVFSALDKTGQEYQLFITRDGQEQVLNIKPAYNEEEGRYISGIGGSVLPPSANPFIFIPNGYNLMVDSVLNTFTSFKMLFTGKAGLQDLSGPVGMVKLTNDIVGARGIIGLVSFTALLSINLGIINLLPIPALDGGRIVILMVESITRKSMNPRVEAALINVSFILLLGLIILVTFSDVTKFFR